MVKKFAWTFLVTKSNKQANKIWDDIFDFFDVVKKLAACWLTLELQLTIFEKKK